MKLIISKSASGYLRHEHAYLAQFDPRAAQSMIQQLQEAMRMLVTYPEMGSLVLPMKGRRRLVSVPYLIDYRATAATIRIVAIRHGRQLDLRLDIDDAEMDEPD